MEKLLAKIQLENAIRSMYQNFTLEEFKEWIVIDFPLPQSVYNNVLKDLEELERYDLCLEVIKIKKKLNELSHIQTS